MTPTSTPNLAHLRAHFFPFRRSVPFFPRHTFIVSSSSPFPIRPRPCYNPAHGARNSRSCSLFASAQDDHRRWHHLVSRFGRCLPSSNACVHQKSSQTLIRSGGSGAIRLYAPPKVARKNHSRRRQAHRSKCRFILGSLAPTPPSSCHAPPRNLPRRKTRH